jgi:hypothetical protein
VLTNQTDLNPTILLGPWVALSYTRALAKKKSYILYRHRSGMHPLKNTFNAVLAVDQIRWAIAERRTTDFVKQSLAHAYMNADLNFAVFST